MGMEERARTPGDTSRGERDTLDERKGLPAGEGYSPTPDSSQALLTPPPPRAVPPLAAATPSFDNLTSSSRATRISLISFLSRTRVLSSLGSSPRRLFAFDQLRGESRAPDERRRTEKCGPTLEGRNKSLPFRVSKLGWSGWCCCCCLLAVGWITINGR